MDLEARMRAAGKRYKTASRAVLEARAAVHALAVEAAAAGLSQHHVARLLGVDRMTIRKWLGER